MVTHKLDMLEKQMIYTGLDSPSAGRIRKRAVKQEVS